MTLCCISDTHSKHAQLSLDGYPADVLIHAGDFTGSESPMAIILFLEWFDAQPYKHKILIAGNHELFVQDNNEWFLGLAKTFPGITYLQDTATTINGVVFYGSPYSNNFCDWAFMEKEQELKAIWDNIPLDTNVLITHGPAYGIHDLVKNAHSRDPHVGSLTLAERRKELPNLKVHISGHIHEAHGKSVVDGVQNVCPCILNERYKAINSPIIVEV